MDFTDGYVYHIKDDYFQKVNDDKLMQNKENGNYRPTFFCMRDDSEPSLFWVVPMSTRIEKYQAIQEKQTAKYGDCITIVIGEYDNRKSAFLLQNMFPITQDYLDHVHTRNGNPVPVNHSTQQNVKSKMKQLRRLHGKGYKLVFPDISRLEKIMLDEINRNRISLLIAAQKADPEQPSTKKLSIHERIEAAKAQIAQRDTQPATPAPQHKNDCPER